MKFLTMLSLSMMSVLALMTYFGPTSVSAAVLCETDSSPCSSGWDVGKGEVIEASLKSGKIAVLKAAFTETACGRSTIEAKITNTGGLGKSVEAEITEVTFEECICGSRIAHVTETTSGTLAINDAGTMFSANERVTIDCTGLAKCTLGTVASGTDLGKFTDTTSTNATADLDVEATITWSSVVGESSQFVCTGFGDTATWTGLYQLTVPDAVVLTAS